MPRVICAIVISLASLAAASAQQAPARNVVIVINISSLSGLTPIPFMGMYSASKFALEGYTEALRLAVKPFNIHVSQIEAGFLKSPMMEHRQIAGPQMREYDPWRQRAL